MNVYQSCSDTSDAIELSLSQSLYLKPIARLHISVQLPQLKVPGKSISNWEVMEKVRNIIKPEEFSSLKVSKSTFEFVRLEAEIENKSKIQLMLAKLDGRTIKLSGFADLLKVRAAEAKLPYPTRHMWDSYFRDSKHMNDIKPGERPDTIHMCNIPCKWFQDKSCETGDRDLPSECIFKKVFETFGEIRCVDIPILDTVRNAARNSSGIQTFYFGQDHSFEGYVQFKEYVCFVKAMTALKGMKLLYKDGGKAWTANIKVDFDRTKHLSDESICRRQMEREKIMLEKRLMKEEEDKKREEACKKKLEEEMKLTRKNELVLEKEEQKREVPVEVKEDEDDNKMSVNESNKLKSMRLLHFLLDKARVRMEEELHLKDKKKLVNGTKMKIKEANPVNNKLELVHKEKELRRKLLLKYKSLIVKRLESEEQKVKDMIGIKKHLPDDGFSTDPKHCSDEEGIYFNRDSSTEMSSLSGELRAVALAVPEARKGMQKQGFHVDFPKCNIKSESFLSDAESVREDVFQAICDPDNQLMTRNYVDSLSDFCQRHLNREVPKAVSSRTSCNSQSDEDIDIIQKKIELKRKIGEKEKYFCKGELSTKKKRS